MNILEIAYSWFTSLNKDNPNAYIYNTFYFAVFGAFLSTIYVAIGCAVRQDSIYYETRIVLVGVMIANIFVAACMV